MAGDIKAVSIHLLRGSGAMGDDRPLPLPATANVEIAGSRAELLSTLSSVEPNAKAIVAVEIGAPDPTGKNLRVIESIRRSSRLSGLCRPIAIGYSAADRDAADRSGAYAFILVSDDLSTEGVEDVLTRVATRVPRDLAHSRGPFIDLAPPASLKVADDAGFERVFRSHFKVDPGPLDVRIIRAWAVETPDKTLVEAIGEDPDSGWTDSAVRRRIERLRDRAPVLFRDATGNLAKGRLARQFPPIPPDGEIDEFALWPDVDRCIALSGDDELMKIAHLDDGARAALDSVISRRMVESQRRGGRPPAGSRLRQLSTDLSNAYDDTFSTRFADESDFRSAVRRALLAIADAQLDETPIAAGAER